MNYYEILELTKEANLEDIKKQYRKLAMKYHPDRTAGDKKKEELFKNISVAYETLSDPIKKKNYDNQLNSAFSGDSFNNGFSSGQYHSFNETSFGGNDFSSIFDELLRQRKNQSSYSGPKKIEVKLDFWEAVFGVQKQFHINYTLESGKKREDDITVWIPSGLNNNDMLEVKSQSGDVFILILKIPDASEDKNYKKVGADLYTVLEIPFTTAILGKTIMFEHWDSSLEIKIPAGIESGQLIRLKSKGIKAEPKFGDLYIEIKVKIPKKINKQLKEKIEQLEKDLGEQSNLEGINSSWKVGKK